MNDLVWIGGSVVIAFGLMMSMAAGMTLVVVWTLVTTEGMLQHWWILLAAGGIGAVIGVLGARRVPMTAMPQMVAIFNGAGGGAAAVVAMSEFLFSVNGRPFSAVRAPIALSPAAARKPRLS